MSTRRTGDSAPSLAAQWFARMQDSERTACDEADFQRWLAQDPANERAYRRLENLWANLTRVHDAPRIQQAREAAVAEARHSAQTLAGAARRRGLGWLAGIAASAVVALAMVANQVLVQENVYETTVGDRRTIQLADGSELTLNTDSRVAVHYGWRGRNVSLERGQARFKVAHSVLRPFWVDAGRGRIRSIGTEFDVYRQADQVHVALLEGRIQVTSLEAPSSGRGPRAAGKQPAAAAGTGAAAPQVLDMTAGQQTSLSAQGFAPVRHIDAAQATAWLDGKLVFDDVRLLDAVEDVNRYSTRKIHVLDAGLGDLRVNGVFRTDRADAFIEAVRRSLPVTIQPTADGSLVIAPR